jgi:hypothetical protein
MLWTWSGRIGMTPFGGFLPTSVQLLYPKALSYARYAVGEVKVNGPVRTGPTSLAIEC